MCSQRPPSSSQRWRHLINDGYSVSGVLEQEGPHKVQACRECAQRRVLSSGARRVDERSTAGNSGSSGASASAGAPQPTCAL